MMPHPSDTNHRQPPEKAAHLADQTGLAELNVPVRLEEVVRQRGVPLQTASREEGEERLEDHCPFHPYDEMLSFNVYLRSQRYHCFGCGADGDVLDFVQQFDLCSKEEAIERLQTNIVPLVTGKLLHQRTPRQVIPVPFPRPEETITQPYHVLLTAWSQSAHQALLNHPALCALLEREFGITQEGIRLCHLGYADGTLPALLEHEGWADEAHMQMLHTIGALTPRGYERLRQRLLLGEWNTNQQCTWITGFQVTSTSLQHLDQSSQTQRRPAPTSLDLALPKPLLGYGHACQRIKSKALIRAILLVHDPVEYVLVTQWAIQERLPIVSVAITGTTVSRHQLALLLDLQQRASSVPILVHSGRDKEERQRCARLIRHLIQRNRSVRDANWQFSPHQQDSMFLQRAIEQAIQSEPRHSLRDKPL